MQSPTAQTTNSKGNDAEIASWLIVDNHGEVALAKLAEERSSNDSVKKFAKEMVDDHSKFIDQLKKFAGATGAMSHIPMQGQPQTGTLNFVDFKQRLGQKCLESARSELEKKQGDQFDRCYVDQQVVAHMTMLDTLEVFKDYASPDLRSVIDNGISTTQEHLKKAKDLAQQLQPRSSQQQTSQNNNPSTTNSAGA